MSTAHVWPSTCRNCCSTRRAGVELMQPTTSPDNRVTPRPERAERLCSRCAILDVDELLDQHSASHFDEDITIWSWNDYDDPDWLKPDCAFCQLVDIVKKPHDTSQAGLWYWSPPEFLYLLSNLKSSRPIPLGLKKEVRRNTIDSTNSSTVWRDKAGRTWRNWTLFLASRGSVQVQSNLVIRDIDAHHIDFDIVKGWLTRDGASSSKTRVLVNHDIPARLVDCRTRTIVPAAQHPYLALSYVWGQAVFESDRGYSGGEDLLPNAIPATIADAISVTQQLGYRYLWVDKYSINQADAFSKLYDIQNMDTIFRSAEATLIAAAGQDAQYGLPGVNARSRKPPVSARLGEFSFTILSSTSVVQDMIRQYKWNSRGKLSLPSVPASA